MKAKTLANLNLRMSPTTNSSILYIIPVATTIDILSEVNNDWVKVHYNGAEGYCAKSYLDTTRYQLALLTEKIHDLEKRISVLEGMKPPLPGIDLDVTRKALAYSLLNHRINTHTDDEWYIKDVFYTFNGSWEVGTQQSSFAIERWARDEYLKPLGHQRYFDDAGADNHILALARDVDGTYLDNVKFTQRWPTGSDTSGVKKSGWANWVIGRNIYYPDKGEEGPFSVTISRQKAPVLHGIGLPYGLHVSTFVVFQRER